MICKIRKTVIISVLVAINKNEKDEVKYFSEYDAMTGVYNRRVGFEKLSQLYKNIGKENCTISVCFVDINGLKEVNDALGHEAGDELILSVITGIKKNIRNADFVARLGGDEFLIIFDGLSKDKSEEIWGRIVNEYYARRKMMESMNKFTLTNEEGIEVTYEALKILENPETKKKYVLYTEIDSIKEITGKDAVIHASRYRKEDGKIVLEEMEYEKEWTLVKNFLQGIN